VTACSPAQSEVKDSVVESNIQRPTIDPLRLADLAAKPRFAELPPVAAKPDAEQVNRNLQQLAQILRRPDTTPGPDENCTLCQRDGFQRVEKSLTGDALVTCRQVRSDFAEAERLWKEFETQHKEFQALTRSLSDPVTSAQLRELQVRIEEMETMLLALATVYPKNYRETDRRVVYRWDLTRLKTTIQDDQKYLLKDLEVLEFSMAGATWRRGLPWDIEELRRVIAPPVRLDDEFSFEVEENPLIACLERESIAVRVDLQYVLKTFLEPPEIEVSPFRPGITLPAPLPREPRQPGAPGFLLSDGLAEYKLAPSSSFNKTYVVLTNVLEVFQPPARRP